MKRKQVMKKGIYSYFLISSECCLEDYFLNQTCYFCLNKIDPEFYNDLFNLFGICNSTEEMKRNLRFIFQRRDYISDSSDYSLEFLLYR